MTRMPSILGSSAQSSGGSCRSDAGPAAGAGGYQGRVKVGMEVSDVGENSTMSQFRTPSESRAQTHVSRSGTRLEPFGWHFGPLEFAACWLYDCSLTFEGPGGEPGAQAPNQRIPFSPMHSAAGKLSRDCSPFFGRSRTPPTRWA